MPPAESKLKGKKILWVEDDAFLKGIISHKLTQEGATVLYAQNGEEALASAGNEKPDMIVLDILLPGFDGVEVLRRLKADPNLAAIPVVMFSNVDDKDRVEEARKLGSKGFFVKTSVTMDEIITQLGQVFGQ